MLKLLAATAMILAGCGGSGPPPLTAGGETRVVVENGHGATVLGADGAWIGGAPGNTRVFIGADGQTYVGIWIEAPDAVPEQVVRAPMAVSLVIDTSGSMEGDKIANARMAAASLLESLADGDVVSVYAFSNEVMEIAAPTVIGAGTRSTLMQQVSALNAAGGTNMYDGVRVGEARLAEAPPSHPVRRLVLISDGHANIGPSDPRSLGMLAANGTEWGAQVSAIGVGLDYDERTLAALAVESSGRMYHLEHPAQMAEILNTELELLAHTVATNAWVDVVPLPGVVILGAESSGASLEDGHLRMQLGSLHAGQSRELLFRAQIDTSRVGTRPLAQARLVYREPGAGGEERAQTVALAYEVTDDRGAAEASAEPRVMAMLANHQAAQAQIRAAELMNQGRSQDAVRQLQFAEDQLEGAARAAPSAPAAASLRSRAARVRQSGAAASGARTREEMRATSLEVNDAAMGDMGY